MVDMHQERVALVILYVLTFFVFKKSGPKRGINIALQFSSKQKRAGYQSQIFEQVDYLL